MKIIGLTGGIGSGKTTIAHFFRDLGIPVYIADKEAKALMNRSKVIKRKLIQLFGKQAYIDGQLNRSFIAQCIFNNKSLLSKMNAIVHPKVASHFRQWLKKQEGPYVIKEAAVIFENQLQSQYDLIITVVAEEKNRIKRVMQRDGSTEERVKAIIKNQLSDEEKIQRSDFVIENNNLRDAKKQVLNIHNCILKKIAQELR
ncbi:dephospho-CoA kinase [Winogradskyella aurantia]|uniref:Dephospho-CoA kinase n=1 Tax=Winogradskyella aurantia TaxID=1915063 RepID=A0A265UMU7_9FLAO|nr:dephospho-CoA kinase [Winogradskyella aurantia]OZV66589.1 dephospho-CoA kinase [Winogradskyella aurantia]